jgi:hypothetical protein
MRLVEHVAFTGEVRNAYNILADKTERRKSRLIWVDKGKGKGKIVSVLN